MCKMIFLLCYVFDLFQWIFFSSIIDIDDVEKFTSEMHDPCARSRCLQKRTTQKYLTGGIGVESAKHPLKVKSEIFLQLYSAREELVTRIFLCEEDVGVFIVVRPLLLSL